MKFLKIFKDIRGVFIPPVKTYYFGNLRYGCPYFWPRNFVSSIISARKLKLRTEEEYKKHSEKYPHFRDQPTNKFSNLPMVRRAKYKIIKLFGNYYFVQFGWPISIHTNELGWKDKFDSPRFEWPPAFFIYFFGLQFCIWWNAPKIESEEYFNNDTYYEMILWYLKYTDDKDIKTAEETWGWVDFDTKESTWNKNYLK